ncbi:hypothetical protein EGW08_022580, partial [Elysia chlorotica]
MFNLVTFVSVFAISTISSQACPQNSFGDKCQLMCHCNGGGANCENGYCKNGCASPYIGDQCQYKAFPPVSQSGLRWLSDSNPNTCNQGTPELQVKPSFTTAVLYIRMTFK